jgi:hypothetical protein
LNVTEATADEIILIWTENIDAQDYKIYWDKGLDDKMTLLNGLTSTTNKQTRYVVNSETSQGILGSEKTQEFGATFKFSVSYTSIKTGRESAMSDVLSVTVPKNI